LVPPGQGKNEVGFEVVLKKTANPNNFTSFIKFVPARIFNEGDLIIGSWLTGISMPSFRNSLGDAEQLFFAQLLEPIQCHPVFAEDEGCKWLMGKAMPQK
jgi:hypothetical protein